MLITVQRITSSIEFAKGDPTKPPPLPPKALKKAEGPEMVLPASIARLERAADDHGRRLTAFGPRAQVIARRRSPGPATSGPPLLSAAGHGSGGAVSAAAQRAMRMSRGEPLPGSVLGTLETHFGRSFGDVRVHTDRAAGEAARGLRARAFALGSHIYFAPGQFNPSTPLGLGLIGHEVAHVDQFHRGLSGLGATHSKALGLSIGSDRLERFADDHQRRLAGGRTTAASAIESFTLRLSEQVGPAARAALERIASAAVERASEELERAHVSATVEELSIESTIDLGKPEDKEVARLAERIVRAARARARSTGPARGVTIHTSTPKGVLSVEAGRTLSPQEQAAVDFWLDQGKDVFAPRPLSEKGIQNVRTADFDVKEVGRVDVWDPEPTTDADNLVRGILKKSGQAATVQVELPADSVVTADEVNRLPRRVFGHPKAGKSIQRIVVRRGGKVILDEQRR